MACVDVPALPLQILLCRHRDWSVQPVAVVDRDKPQGVILWVNEAARKSRILPGMRYAAALSLDRELRAGVVSEEEVEEQVRALTECLWSSSPKVEPAPKEPGIFWLDASGLLPLYRSYREWAQRLRAQIKEAGFFSVVAIGFSKFASYAAVRSLAARSNDLVLVFETSAEESAHCRAVRIDRLAFQPRFRDTLHELGIRTLGEFLELPAAGIRRRFGKDAYDLYCRARGEGALDLDAERISEPLEKSILLDRPEEDLVRLVAAIDTLLVPLLSALRRRHEALTHIELILELDDAEKIHESLQPAEPTLNEKQLGGLISLRLEGVELSAGVIEITLQIRGVPSTTRQLDMFQAPPRDLSAARRALARIRAEFGDHSVVRARLEEGHLPEARFAWEQFVALDTPNPKSVELRPLIRRFYPQPVPLPLRDRYEPDGWILSLGDGPVEEVVGPQVVSGGWWVREVEREYYFVRTRSGRWLWIYNDRQRRRWFLQGEVE